MRPLNHIEQAFTDSNEVNPLCVVIVLRLRGGPRQEMLRSALDELQRLHVLLRCGISTGVKPYRFVPMDPSAPIPLTTVSRSGPDDWESVVERELNTRFDPSGPLIRVVRVGGESDDSELVLVLHHAVMDGVSARLLLDEILNLSNGEQVTPPLPESEQVARHRFPPAYRGAALASRLVPFLARQMLSEIHFARHGADVRPAASPQNRVLHLKLTTHESRRLNLRIGREGLSLNAVLNAALLRAVRVKLHAEDGNSPGSEKLMRAIFFANLRPSLEPVPDEAVLGCMISMLRVSTLVAPDDPMFDIARRLKREIFMAAKAGDPYMAAFLARPMVRLAFKANRGRIGNAAVSFLGKLDLLPEYGSTQLLDVHAFITNNVVGPELSGFGKVLFGRIELDMTYLSSEISEVQARELLTEVEVSLRKLAG